MTAPTSDESVNAPFGVIDLFAGPGGLDVAARHLGVPVVAGIEWDKDACATRVAAGLPTEPGDVRKFGPSDFPSATVLTGGPPCQTYTVAGGGAGRRDLDDTIGLAKRMAAREDVSAHLAGLDDERTGLVLEPLRWALAAIDSGNPYEAIVLEQVQAALPVWVVMRELLEAEGYSVAPPAVLHTEQFGVPQTRRRAILIARRSTEAVMPRPTHRVYRKSEERHEGDRALLPWVPMGEVLGQSRRYPFSVVSNYGTGGNPKDRGRRLSTEPSATVTGKISRNRVWHGNHTEIEMDRFSNAEAGLLQTFPADYPWAGNAIPQQIGNAIPPRLGVHVLAAALGLDDETVDRALAVTEWTAIG
ncbi:DNA cytosine methyltransferase [Streptomyces sp. NPDC001985]|uniref:DNA cytosine methyltransferase n=1 Tax=Streptomyces sp. NPDC001985 TaxID=3154406 RepID=UPI003328FB90